MDSKTYTQEQVDLFKMSKDIEFIKSDVSDIKKRQNDSFVTRDEFEPIKKIVYGLVSLILTAFIGAVIALVIKK